MKNFLLKIGTWIFLGPALEKPLEIDDKQKMVLVNIIAIIGTAYIILFFTFLLRGMISTSNVITAYISAFIFLAASAIIHTVKGIKYFNIVRIIVVINILFFFGYIYVDEVIYGKIWAFLIPIVVIFLTNLYIGLILCACYFVFTISMEYIFFITNWKLICYSCAYWSQVMVASVYETLRINYNKKQLKDKKEMEILNITDHLTKLYNRRYFSESIEKEFARAIRQKDGLSFLMIDADYFKNYNDTYGHLQGDELLISLAAIFKNVIKRPGDLVFRMGGEEFGILLPATDFKGAFSIAEKIREEVHNKTEITVSIGVASVFPQARDCLEKLLKLADSNLYKAKEMGRNKVIG